MNTFTKLVVNGEERYAAAFYDGSGNDIATTYETIAKVSEKEQALAGRITTVNEALVALTGRVAATEAFDARITKNAEDINTNKEAIATLQGTDSNYREELNTLTIKIGTNTDNITTLDDDLNTLSKTVTRLSNDVGDLEAIITDEATGIDALNETKADKTSVNLSVENLSTRLSSLESVKDNYKSADETVLSTSQEYTNTEIGKLTEVYDSKGAAAGALESANAYADSLAGNYDAAGTAAGFNEAMDARVKVLEEIDHGAYVGADAAVLASANKYTDDKFAEVPSLEGYATEEFVTSQGYLTAHQDISNLATKEELNQKANTSEVSALQSSVQSLVNTVNDLTARIEALENASSTE